ncbi:MAG: nucleotidyltransferase domain-containing protein [Chloroflexota bacterium]
MRIAFLDRDQAIVELVECVERLLARDGRVLAVGLFGSLARREALPSSDADLLIVLREHPQRRWFDRIPDYADAFAGVSLPVDVFPYTVDELARMISHRSGFLHTVFRELISLGGDARIWRDLEREGIDQPGYAVAQEYMGNVHLEPREDDPET